MALVKCPDCGKSVSDKATACNACGCPIGSVGSGNYAFEKRIEQYKANGYNLGKRKGDTVHMIKKSAFKVSMLITTPLIALAGILDAMCHIYNGYTSYALLWFGILGCVFGFLIPKALTASITITKTGKIEETGYILKNKKRK